MRGFCAKLLNGREILEWEIQKNTEPAIETLRKILRDENTKIAEFSLIFDNQKIHVRNHAAIYFYARRVDVWLDLDCTNRHFYAIGVQEKPGEIEITWYDGENSEIEIRKINPNDKGLIYNDPKESTKKLDN